MKLQNIISTNPGKNYEIIGQIPITPRDEINRKITQAKTAQRSWAALGLKKRLAILEALYHAFLKRKDELALLVTREIGMPIAQSQLVDIGFGLEYMRGYLDYSEKWLAPEIVFENEKEIHMLVFEPRGVAAVSIPWNYPFCNFIWGTIQNLIVGNTVIFKHSEECPFTSKLIEDIILSINLPEGIFNQVYGDGADVGEYIMNRPVDLIYFTGSTGVGKHLYQVAAKNFIPAILELGGSAAGIVFEDADIDAAVESMYLYRFINNGQTCDALKRLLVHKSIFNEIIEKLTNTIKSKKIGNPEDPSTDIGSLAAERQLLGLEAQVADAVKKGAHIVTGGKRPAGLQGAYYEPTLLKNISFDMQVWKEEVFGPVLPVVPFNSEEEAIALANDSQYGLGGYVYTKNKDRALRVSMQLQTGNINVNDTNYVIAQIPFGGYKYSGLGREHGQQGLREFCSSKVISLTK